MMKGLFKQYGIPIGVVLIFLLFGSIVYVLASLGKAYQSNIGEYAPPTIKNQEVSGKTKKNVKKITLSRPGDTGCIELTPDGAVRIYSTCGATIIDAKRLVNISNLYRLFDKVTDLSASDNQTKGTGTVYEIRVETDTGTEVYYVTLENSSSDTSGLTILVGQVLGDVPTPSPQLPAITPTTAVSPTSTRTPTPGSSPTPVSPTPTPLAPTGQPFSCDFSDSDSQGNPYRISNTVCTSGPTPGP